MGEFQDYIYQGFKYKLYVPKKYSADRKTPLMVMLHGCGQDPDDFASGTEMNDLADKENFLVLYPNMNHLFNPSDPAGYNPFGCWNWFLDKNQHRGQGHPKLIFEIIEEVKRGYAIDPKKVYAAGLSAGGSLACILGVTYPDVFAAIGICSGLAYDAANVFFLTDPMAEDAKKSMEKGVPDPYACGYNAYKEMGRHKKKMPVIVFHGVSDTTVHPINGQQVITQWAQTNFLVEGGNGHTDVKPDFVNAGVINGKSYTQHIFNDGSGEPLLELWMIDNLGHAWSGGSPKGSYTDQDGPKATDIMWKFFVNIDEAYSSHQFETQKRNGEEKVLEILHVETPAQNAEHSQGEEAPITEVHLSDEPSAQSSDHSAPELPVPSHDKNHSNKKALVGESHIHSQGQAEVETKIQLPKESLKKNTAKSLESFEEIPAEPPKKKLFSTLFSKLIKRKDKGAS